MDVLEAVGLCHRLFPIDSIAEPELCPGIPDMQCPDADGEADISNISTILTGI